MYVVAALGQLAAQLGADDPAAAVSGEDCNADVHRGGWWLVAGGWWLVAGAGHFQTNHQPPTTIHHLRIHIHRSRQQRDGVVDVQRLSDEERFAPFAPDQRAEITVAGFYFAQERPRADARLRFCRLRIEELRGVRADRFPFALGSFADVDDEARRDRAWEEKIRYARRPPPLLARLQVVFRQTGDMTGFAHELGCVRVVGMRVFPGLGEVQAMPQPPERADRFYSRLLVRPNAGVAQIEIFTD